MEKNIEQQKQIGIILPFLPGKYDVNKIANTISTFYSKAKIEVEFIVASKDEALIKQLQEHKKLAGFVEEEKIKCFKSQKQPYKEALEKGTSKYYVILNPEAINNVNHISNWYHQNKQGLTTDKIFSLQKKSKKKGQGPKGIAAFLAGLTMPFKKDTIGQGIFLMHKDIANKLLPSISGSFKDIMIEIPFKARLHEIPIKKTNLRNLEELPVKLSTGSVLNNYFRIRLKWFVKEPVQQTFCKEHKIGVSAWSGKHPVYRLLFFSLAIFAFFFMPIMSFDYGITWDEPEDHEYFEKVWSYFQTGGEDKSCLDMSELINTHLVYYGPLVNLTCVVADKYISPFGLYETRHIIISLFGFFAMLFAGLLAKRLGNWKTGFFAILFIFLTPFFFGSSMNNQKDIPFAALYIISAYYIIIFIQQLPKPSSKLITTLAIVIGLTISIRIAGLLTLAYLGLFMAIFWIVYTRKYKLKESAKLIPRFLKYIIVIGIFAYIIGIILWPFALQDPIKNPFIALSRFEKFSMVHIWELFDGVKTYMKEFPWYYAPKFILITTPLFVLAGLAMAIVGIKKMFKNYGSGPVIMVLFISLFPLLYIIYKESNLYSNWRHVYFIYPSTIVLAVLGWDWVINAVNHKSIKVLIVVILGLLLIKPTIWSIRNHPYQYTYYNELVGGLKGVYGKYETDYWCQSPREAVEWLIENEPVIDNVTKIATNNEPVSLSYYAKKHTDSIKILWARTFEWNKKDWDYAIWTTRTLPKQLLENGYFPPKNTIHTIDAGGIPLAAIVKREKDYFPKAYNYFNKRKLDSALYYFKKAAEYYPLEEEAPRNIGWCYFVKRDFEKAKKYLYESIELYKPNPIAYYFLGLIAFNENKHDEAEELLKKAIEYKQNLSVAYSLLGDIYFTHKKYNAAIHNYRQFLRYQGHSAVIYNQIGKVYLALKNPREAIKNFEMAIRVNKNFAEGYHNLGYAYTKIGQKKKGRQLMQKAKQIMGGK